MLTHKTNIRVRYADTDKMQFVYNGKYLEFFEVGRTELLRALGLPYTKIEAAGYQLPVTETHIKYKKPAFYDDVLEIQATANSNLAAIIHIDYIIKRAGTEDIIAEGYTEHIFIKTDTKKPTKWPQIYIDAVTLNSNEDSKK